MAWAPGRLVGILATAALLTACGRRTAAPIVGTPVEASASVSATANVPTLSPTRTPGVDYPDMVRTPGDAFPVGKDEICVTGYTKTVRDVSTATKTRIYTAYGITRARLPNEFEMDHLIPLELGGSNDDRNLWPEAAAPSPGFHQKDQLENKLRDMVCAGGMPLAEAQRAIATDWYAAYLRYVPGAR